MKEFRETGYFINSKGCVFSKRDSNKPLVPKISRDGYLVYKLSVKGKLHYFSAHRMVAETFIENPENHPVVLHLDNDKKNCSVPNLKWGTYQENAQQAVDDGLTPIGEDHGKTVYTSAEVEIIHSLKETGLTKKQIFEELLFNRHIYIYPDTISDILRGKTRKNG